MLIDDITIGSNIELDAKLQGQEISFSSQALMIIDDIVLISPIKVSDQTVGFSENCSVNLLYNLDGKLFIWHKVDIRLVRYDGIVYHSVLLKGEGKPYNRRNAYRLYLGLEMALYLNSQKGPVATSVTVRDISETGVSFITKEEIETSRTFRLKFKDELTRMDLVGSVVRKEYQKHLDSYIYGCKFYEHNKLLARYIARKQGEMLKQRNTTYNAFPIKNITR